MSLDCNFTIVIIQFASLRRHLNGVIVCLLILCLSGALEVTTYGVDAKVQPWKILSACITSKS